MSANSVAWPIRFALRLGRKDAVLFMSDQLVVGGVGTDIVERGSDHRRHRSLEARDGEAAKFKLDLVSEADNPLRFRSDCTAFSSFGSGT